MQADEPIPSTSLTNTVTTSAMATSVATAPIATHTPVLDQLAAVMGGPSPDFDMASAWRSPSRAALLTGCEPLCIGFGDFDGLPVLFPGQRLGSSEITIANVLAEAGYATRNMSASGTADNYFLLLPTCHGVPGSPTAFPTAMTWAASACSRTCPIGSRSFPNPA